MQFSRSAHGPRLSGTLPRNKIQLEVFKKKTATNTDHYFLFSVYLSRGKDYTLYGASSCRLNTPRCGNLSVSCRACHSLLATFNSQSPLCPLFSTYVISPRNSLWRETQLPLSMESPFSYTKEKQLALLENPVQVNL